MLSRAESDRFAIRDTAWRGHVVNCPDTEAAVSRLENNSVRTVGTLRLLSRADIDDVVSQTGVENGVASKVWWLWERAMEPVARPEPAASRAARHAEPPQDGYNGPVFYDLRTVEQILDIAKEPVETVAAGPRKTAQSLRAEACAGPGVGVRKRLAKSINKDAVRHIYHSVSEAAGYRSGVRAWAAFVLLAREIWPFARNAPIFPISEGLMLRWPVMFRNAKTARNYKSACVWASECLGAHCMWHTARVQRAFDGIARKNQQVSSHHTVITASMCAELVARAEHLGDHRFAAAVTLGYAFMLRMGDEFCKQTVEKLRIDERGDVVLSLSSRKNKPQGSRLVRRCCAGGRVCGGLCPHRAAGWLIRNTAPGDTLYTSYGEFLKDLRAYATAAGFDDAQRFGSHGLRRGATVDLASRPDTTLEQLMLAGEWSSKAWQKYASSASVTVMGVAEALVHAVSDDEPDA